MNNRMKFFDKVKTPEEWKERALSHQTDKPRLKSWQTGTLITATAAAVLLMVAVPMFSLKMKAPQPEKTAKKSVSSAQTEDNSPLGLMKKDYEYVLTGTVVESSSSASINVLLDEESNEAYYSYALDHDRSGYSNLKTVRLDPMGCDYTDGKRKSGLGSMTDKDVGDKVALGFVLDKSKTEAEDYLYCDLFDEAGAFANLGVSDDEFYLKMVRSLDNINTADPGLVLSVFDIFNSNKITEPKVSVSGETEDDTYTYETGVAAQTFAQYYDNGESSMPTYFYPIVIGRADGRAMGDPQVEILGGELGQRDGEPRRAVITLPETNEEIAIIPEFNEDHLVFYSACARTGEDGRLYVALQVADQDPYSYYDGTSVKIDTALPNGSTVTSHYNYVESQKFEKIDVKTQLEGDGTLPEVIPHDSILASNWYDDIWEYTYSFDIDQEEKPDGSSYYSYSGSPCFCIDTDGDSQGDMMVSVEGIGPMDPDESIDINTSYLQFSHVMRVTIRWRAQGLKTEPMTIRLGKGKTLDNGEIAEDFDPTQLPYKLIIDN